MKQLLFNKVAGFRKFLRILFLQNICVRLLLCFEIAETRGGYRVRQVRQLKYFSFNRHNDIRL